MTNILIYIDTLLQFTSNVPYFEQFIVEKLGSLWYIRL